MGRLTTKDRDGNYQVEKDAIVGTQEGYSGPAIQKLGRIEDLVEDLMAQQDRLSQELDALRLQGKTRSAQFREKMAHKLTNAHILSALKCALSQC